MRIACILVAPAACAGKEDPGPSCAQGTDHLLAITTTLLPAQRGSAMVPRELMIERCDEKHYAPQVRACMLAATTMAAAGACSGEKPLAPPHQVHHIELQPAGSGSGS